MRYGRLRVDEFTAPGYFVGLLCLAMMFACYATFDPSDGYAKPVQGHKLERRVSHSLASPSIGASPRTGPMRRTQRRPDAVGLAVCLGAFFAHFYSFAIQETITTPFVTARYGWSQRRVDTLFAGVSVLSLATSVLVAELSNRWSAVWKSKFHGAFTPARWRGDAGSSTLDGASTAAPSPRNDLVKNPTLC